MRLRVGQLSGVVPDALSFCFELATAGTALEGAALEIEVQPGRANCRTCSADFSLHDAILLCPCGSADVEVVSGRELAVRSVEVTDMCSTCGCGDADARIVTLDADGHRQTRRESTDTSTAATATGTVQDHVHVDPDPELRTHTLDLEVAVLAKNDELAASNRAWLAERGILALNMMSSPGVGQDHPARAHHCPTPPTGQRRSRATRRPSTTPSESRPRVRGWCR